MNEERCETRKEGVDFLILQKKKIVQERVKIGSVLCHLSSKNNKKGIFQRTFSRLRV
jgi:hypothetical protein